MRYFDNAATTRVSEASLKAYINASETFYNPSSLYKQSGDIKNRIEEARAFFLKTLHGDKKSTFIFTGCATESNNAVISNCVVRKDKKYIFSAGEHSSVYEPAKKLQEAGYNIVFVPLKSNGSIDEDKLYHEIDDKTAFVSIIHVSNETGAINDILTITRKIKTINPNVLIHSDGVQAIGKVDINLKSMGIDFYTISAHKINGPKGVAGLYIANPNKFKSFLIGGEQENGFRSGTENYPGIIAFETAVKKLTKHDYSENKQAILNELNAEYILVSDDKCVDNIISLCFKKVRGETILHILESKGFLIGTGSSCNSKASFNRVLSSIVNKEYLYGAIRISFGDDVTLEDCRELGKEINNAVREYIKRTNK